MKPTLPAAELAAFAAGTHPRPWTLLGAQPAARGRLRGTRFAVWAPQARRVAVVGDFNDWDDQRDALRPAGAGIWAGFVAHARPGHRYKFALTDADGHGLPWKADPYARAAELRPANASVIAAPAPARPLPAARAAANAADAPIAIYEVHAPSWRRGPGGGFANWDDLAATLPAYAADLGFTHVELLPITEHPFDGSWGYQALGAYAPTARLGDTGGLARFVDACHARGLGVLLDWVPAHFPADAHGLARFDGSALYEYADPREGVHRDWGTLIYDWSRPGVANYLAGSALYWLECHGVDGLRVDAVASMLYRDYSRPPGQWLPNVHGGRENLEAIALLARINAAVRARCPGAITCAEDSSAFPGVTAPPEAGGLGFHFKWNLGWMHDTLAYLREDPIHRKWHHGRITFGLSYAFSEHYVLALSHDEVVHGKGSLLAKMPGDAWQRLATLRAYYGFMWGHPGKKLLFMGQEFAQASEWSHDSELPWAQAAEPAHAGVAALVRDLNTRLRATPALHRLDADPAGFEWLVVDDAEQSVFAWRRRDGRGGEAIVVCNFTPLPRHGYRIGLPDDAAGAWREAVNTDSRHYGGSDVGQGGTTIVAEPRPMHGRPRSIALTLPPLATLWLLPA